jgi:hypothetical protein
MIAISILDENSPKLGVIKAFKEYEKCRTSELHKALKIKLGEFNDDPANTVDGRLCVIYDEAALRLALIPNL